MNQRKIWSDQKVRADRLPAAEEFLGRAMEMNDRDESEGRKMSEIDDQGLRKFVDAARASQIIRDRDGWHAPTQSTVIVVLDDENARLRKELHSETDCHLANLATLNKESVVYRSENDCLREYLATAEHELADVRDQLHLATDENDRLRAEVDRYKEQLHHTVGVSAALRVVLDECVALFESYGHDMNWTAKMDALLAKLRTP